MNEQNGSSNPSSTPEVIVKTKKSFSFSLVWLVPVVAALIGGWLVYKAFSEKGPTVTITFKTAEGLEAGKTKIKYKDVEVGQVESIYLSKDGSYVIVTAELRKGAEPHLTENTRFWVERARIGAGGASGLGTLFAGAYIGIDLGEPGGKPTRSFKGLEIPPRNYHRVARQPFQAESRETGFTQHWLAHLLPADQRGTSCGLRDGKRRKRC